MLSESHGTLIVSLVQVYVNLLTVSAAGVEVDTKLIQFSAHSKQIKELTSVVQVLRNVIEHNFTAYVSQLTEDVSGHVCGHVYCIHIA